VHVRTCVTYPWSHALGHVAPFTARQCTAHRQLHRFLPMQVNTAKKDHSNETRAGIPIFAGRPRWSALGNEAGNEGKLLP